jgi:hypothetical protein
MSLDARPEAAAPPAPVLAPKVTAPWVGFLMIAGALVTAVGTFLPFEKVVAFTEDGVYGTFQATGFGSSTTTGHPLGVTAGNGGKLLLGLAILVLVLGALVVKYRGRLWVGIVGLVVSLAALLLGVGALAAPKSDQKDFQAQAGDALTVHALGKLGAPISTVGAALAAIACIVALIARRRRSA